MLTDVQARKAMARTKAYKLTDANGLHLFVSPTGHKSWRWKYRFGGKEQRLVFGPFPEISLSKARALRDDARQVLRLGNDPGLAGKRAKLAVRTGSGATLEEVARQWHTRQKSRWKPVHAMDVITSLERDLFPVIGSFPLDDVDEPLLLAALEKVSGRGAIETTHRLRQRVDAVFKYAKARGLTTLNPARDLRDALPVKPKGKRWPALTDLLQIREFMHAVDTAGASPMSRCASRFLALTAQRPGMVTRAEWAEFEGVDWGQPNLTSPEAIWRVGADRMKLMTDQGGGEDMDHVVPLAPGAVQILHVIRRLTGTGTKVFASSLDADKGLSENTLSALYKRLGWQGRHVPHGWRGSFSSIMNQRVERLHPGEPAFMGDRLIIDLMLAHVPTGVSASELAYNRFGYMERRRELACEWADLVLDGAVPASALLKGPRRSKP